MPPEIGFQCDVNPAEDDIIPELLLSVEGKHFFVSIQAELILPDDDFDPNIQLLPEDGPLRKLKDLPVARGLSFELDLLHLSFVILKKLLKWGVSEHDYLIIIDRIVSCAREMVEQEHNKGRQFLPIEVFIRCAVDFPSEEFEEVPDFDDGEFLGTPAVESSLKTLEMMRVEGQRGKEECSICAEEMEVGCEVTRMPCSHYFHRGCIVKWLRISHLCPLCRFGMPTS